MAVSSDDALEAGREPVEHSKSACHSFLSFELHHKVITWLERNAWEDIEAKFSKPKVLARIMTVLSL